MKHLIRLELVAAVVLLAGGSKGDQTSNAPAPSTVAPQHTVPVSTPVLQPIFTAFQVGNTAQAVDLFTQANWSGRPIFPSGMALGLTDAQFKAIPESERKLKMNEMLTQLDLVKRLAAAISNAGG